MQNPDSKDRPSQTTSRPLARRSVRRRYRCDRCGTWMEERNCKAVCPNCGGQFDCSDLTIHLDELEPPSGEELGGG